MYIIEVIGGDIFGVSEVCDSLRGMVEGKASVTEIHHKDAPSDLITPFEIDEDIFRELDVMAGGKKPELYYFEDGKLKFK